MVGNVAPRGFNFLNRRVFAPSATTFAPRAKRDAHGTSTHYPEIEWSSHDARPNVPSPTAVGLNPCQAVGPIFRSYVQDRFVDNISIGFEHSLNVRKIFLHTCLLSLRIVRFEPLVVTVRRIKIAKSTWTRAGYSSYYSK